MKKIFITLFICMILSMTLVSAFDWDNIQEVELKKGLAGYNDIEIYNSWLIPNVLKGEKLWSGTLDYNTNECGTNCEAIQTITLHEEGSLVDEVIFKTLQDDESWSEQSIRSYQLYIKVGEEERIVEDYEYICENNNPNFCEAVNTKNHTVTDKIWEEYNLGTKMGIGIYEVKLEGRKRPSRTVDWIYKTQGETLNEWATWSNSSLHEGLLAYYRLDGDGEDVFGGNNATASNSRIWSSPGIILTAANFTLGDDELTAPHNASLQPSTISVSAWIYSESIVNNVGIVVKNPDDFNTWSLFQASTGLIWRGGGTTDTLVIPETRTGQWFHLVATQTGTTSKLYINGLLNQSGTTTSAIGSTTSVLAIGYGFTNFLDGLVDEVGIWDRVLGTAEITELYNDGNAVPYPLAVSGVILNSPANDFVTTSNKVIVNTTGTITGATIVNATLYGNASGSFIIINSTTGLSGTTQEVIWNHTFAEGTSGLFTSFCDTDGDCGFSKNITISVDSTPPLITINRPSTIEDFGSLTENQTLNWSIIESNLDSIWWDYNGTNTTLFGKNNQTTFQLEKGLFNGTMYANDSVGNTNSSFISWTYRIFLNSQIFSAETTEGSSEDFSINLTLGSGQSISSANLNYNNTMDASEITTFPNNNVILNNELDIPNIDSDVNITFFYEITLTSGQINTTSNNQSVLSLGLDNCSVFGDLILNYTLRDEETQAFLIGATENTTIEIDVNISTLINNIPVISFSDSYNQTNPAQVCIKNGTLNASFFRLDVQTRYESSGRVSEFHNIQNFTLTNSSIPQNINLFDLSSDDAQVFKIIFKDKNFLPIESALIDIQRKYIAEGVFKSVEIPITDRDGTTVANLVLNEVIYTIVVSKEGEILGVFDNRIAICDNIFTGDCVISLNQLSEGKDIENFETFGGLSFLPSINQSTRNIGIIFTTTDGSSSNVSLTTTKSDNFGTTEVCSDTLVSSTGTLTCSIPTSVGNTTVTSVLSSNGQIIRTFEFRLVDDPKDTFGGSGLMMAIVFVMAMPFLFITDPRGIIIGSLLGLMIVAMLGLYVSGAFLAIGSSVIWIIVVGAIGIYKISEREK